MEQDFKTEKHRSAAFYVIFLLIALLLVLTINTDLAQYAEHKDTGVPAWFFSVLFPLDFLAVAALLLAFFYRKIGVYFFPVLVLVHHVMYEFYLSTTLLSGLHLLFVFIGAGLLVIIPRWKFFR